MNKDLKFVTLLLPHIEKPAVLLRGVDALSVSIFGCRAESKKTVR